MQAGFRDSRGEIREERDCRRSELENEPGTVSSTWSLFINAAAYQADLSCIEMLVCFFKKKTGSR
jgi:hypothetical protein